MKLRNHIISSNVVFYICLLIVAVFAFLQRYPFLEISPIDYDEGFTIYYSSLNLRPWSVFLDGAVSKNYYPPLDFILHHFVYVFSGISIKTIRYVPCFFDILSVILLGLLGKRLCGKVFGIICAFFWAFSPTAIYYAMQARLYSQFCFSFILFLYVLSLYYTNKSFLSGICVSIAIVYGFNVHLLFICVLPIGMAAYLITLFFSNTNDTNEKKSNFNWRSILNDFFKLICFTVIGLIIVVVFYNSYGIFSTVQTNPVTSHYAFYSLSELINKFVIRLYDAIYSDSVCVYRNISNNGCWLIWCLLLLLLFSLLQKRDYFVKSLVFLSVLSIPFFDILIIFKGYKFTGRNDIRFVYWFVPMIWLGISYAFLLIQQIALLCINKFSNKRLLLNKVISIFISFILILLFDFYVIRSNRICVQHFVKNRYWNLDKWINANSIKHNIDFYITKKPYEWRAYDYISVLDYPGKSNVTCNTVVKLDKMLIQRNTGVESKIIEILEGKRILAFVVLDEVFPWDVDLFRTLDLGVEKIYVFIPPYKIRPTQFKKYEDLFGKRFSEIFTGNSDDNSKITNMPWVVSRFYEKLTNNLILNGDFSNGVRYWNNDNAKIIYSDEADLVELTGNSKNQVYIWQHVNMISGHTYKLSFKLKFNNGEALAILRDDILNKEDYLFGSKSTKLKEYTKTFKPNRNGKYKLYLTCKGEGKYYFSDVMLIDTDIN